VGNSSMYLSDTNNTLCEAEASLAIVSETVYGADYLYRT
jgi:hypothetical protein